MVYEWKNKVVLITGGATGIGGLVTRYLMNEGVKHVAFLDVKEQEGIALQNELNAKYGANKVKFYKVDVTKDDQLLGAFDAVVAGQGNLDVVINNAGIMNDTLPVYKTAIAVNVTALIAGTIKALDIMGKDKGGKGGTIINVSSIAALHHSPLFPIYYGTKAAVLQFTNCIALDHYYSKTGVRVLSMCFGATDTGLVHPTNIGNFKDDIETTLEVLKGFPMQTPENAARGVIDAFKLGENGSTWLSTTERPVKDITDAVKKAYAIMAEPVFE